MSLQENGPDIRDTFFDSLIKARSEDDSVFILSADMDSFSLREFCERYPDHYLNVGVSEQNMINVAAGLALTGKKVFCYSIASFTTLRCFEQIKIHVGSMRLPVSIIGAGAGFSFGYDGPTHHGHQDLSAMRLIPEMEIIELSSGEVARRTVESLTSRPRPSYIRLDKGPFPEHDDVKADFSRGIRLVSQIDAGRVAIISNGYMMRVADQVYRSLYTKGYGSKLLDLFVVKPINTDYLKSLLEEVDLVISIEESCVNGGLATSLLEEREKIGKSWELLAIGAPEKQFIEYGDREWFHEKYGLTSESIVRRVVNCLK